MKVHYVAWTRDILFSFFTSSLLIALDQHSSGYQLTAKSISGVFSRRFVAFILVWFVTVVLLAALRIWWASKYPGLLSPAVGTTLVVALPLAYGVTGGNLMLFLVAETAVVSVFAILFTMFPGRFSVPSVVLLIGFHYVLWAFVFLDWNQFGFLALWPSLDSWWLDWDYRSLTYPGIGLLAALAWARCENPARKGAVA